MSFLKFTKSLLFAAAGMLAAFDLIAALPKPGEDNAKGVIYQNEDEARAALVKEMENAHHRTEAEFRQVQTVQLRTMERVSVDDVRAFLAKKQTLAGVLNSFGLPL